MLVWIPAAVATWCTLGVLVAVPFRLAGGGRGVAGVKGSSVAAPWPAGSTAGTYVLASTRGERVNEAVAPFAAEPVELRGRLERRGDLNVLHVDAAEIRGR